MTTWQQFLMIAGVHFLALVSPGPDFFLVLRSAVANGVRLASGVCFGIALANGVYIGVAISGVAMLQELTGLLTVLKWSGCAYLAWLGWCFLSIRGEVGVAAMSDVGSASASWWSECRIGFLSGILNPKNSLFYASLFSLGFVPQTSIFVRLSYGMWMFLAVFFWDLFIALVADHPLLVCHFTAHIHLLERMTGAVLLTIAVVMCWSFCA